MDKRDAGEVAGELARLAREKGELFWSDTGQPLILLPGLHGGYALFNLRSKRYGKDRMKKWLRAHYMVSQSYDAPPRSAVNSAISYLESLCEHEGRRVSMASVKEWTDDHIKRENLDPSGKIEREKLDLSRKMRY